MDRQAPFEFSIVAIGPNGEKKIYDGKDIRTGGFHTRIEASVPAGTRSLVFRLTSPENKGMKLDDLFLVPCIPMKVNPAGGDGLFRLPGDGAYPVQPRSFSECPGGRLP